MSAFDNAHSRLVASAKIALPLAALALLSTLFLFSGKIDPSDAIPYATVNVEELAREPRLTAPEFSGMTEDGAALSVTAATARPGSTEAGASAADMTARLETPGGLVTTLAATEGWMDPTAGLIRFSGRVTLATSTGYRMATGQLDAATDRSRLTAPGPVEGSAPFGTLAAGAMQLTPDDTGVTHVLVFNGGVKLVYDPKE